MRLYLALLVCFPLPLTIEAVEWLDQSESTQPAPCPYILYWGGLEARFTHDESTDAYTAELKLSPEVVWEAIKREPRLWDGQTLLETLALEVNGIVIRSDYNHPETYQSSLEPLKGVIKALKEDDRITFQKIQLPGNKYGSLTLLIGRSEFPKKTETVRYGVAAIHWGKNTFAQGEKRFMTTAELWDLLLSEPQIEYSNQTFRKPEQWNVGIFNEQDPLIRLWADRSDAFNFNQLRERLDQEYDNIKAGATILFSAWGLLDDAPKSQLDTFITYDPLTRKKTSTVVPAGIGFFAEEVISCRIIGEEDPRRFLKLEDQHAYQIKWGAFSESAPKSVFAQAYFNPDEAGVLHADNSMTMWNNRLTKKEIIDMVRQKPEIFRGKELLNDFSFTLSYQGQDYFSEQGQTPADLVKKLERVLKAGDTLKISGIQARTNPGRYVVGFAQTLKNFTELDSKMQTAEVLGVLISGEKQQVLRLNLPVAEFEALRPKLEKTPGIWLQQGDIDLTPFTLELEVRDEDHKPPLPANKKD
ncbi:MAG: hypothetical protein SH848_18420 [Saprospiraceae bacterium]|nr:hypothetical protein [Saprospiraceae bacterium]